MTVLIIGLTLFLGMHSVSIIRPHLREQVVARYGEKRWQGVYALFSLLGIVLVGRGFSAASGADPQLYFSPDWLHHPAHLLMLPVFPLLFAAYLPGRISAFLRHPMLIAVVLWASAHLLVNGGLADVLLFAAFLIWALANLLSLRTRSAPPVQGAPVSRWNDLIAIVFGLAIYASFVFWLHRLLFGVALV